MKGHDIGKALSLVHRVSRAHDEDEEYGRAMGAPMSELRPIIARGQAKTWRRIKRQVKAITGLKWRVFVAEVERRTSARYVHFHTSIGEACDTNGRH